MVTVSATEASQKFATLLRGVRTGKSYRITYRGKAVAELRSAVRESDAEKERRKKALGALLDRLNSQPVLNLPHITRDEMHDQ